jgi:modulator of FtsH protease HflK
MPWNSDDEGSGGPWGQQPRGPRRPSNNNNSGGRGGGGPIPPDLDEFLKKGKDNIKNMMPGGRGTFLIPVLLVAALIVYNSVYQIQPDEQGIVQRLGAYNRTMNPGLHFALWPVERAEKVRTGAENLTLIGESGDEGLMLTGDQNMIDTNFKVQWRILDPKAYLFNITDPQDQFVKTVSESAMREVVGRTPASIAYTTQRFAIAQQVADIIQRTLDQYKSGIQITGVTLEKVDPPPEVADAFADVQRAQQDQQALINGAQQYTNKTLRNAEGASAKILEDARGYSFRVINEAKGESQRFLQVFQEYAKAKDVTRQRIYLETMENVFGRTNKIILDAQQGGNGGVVPYLPLPSIQPKAPVAANQSDAANTGTTP